MAAKKAKKYPDITKLTGLKWNKEKPEEYEPECIDTCDFCGANILITHNYYTAVNPIEHRDCGDPIAVSCQSCATKAGLEW